jgi:tripartite-type tricarboxylate transporter receptor subunit TctC
MQSQSAQRHFSLFQQIFAFLAPAGTPKEIVQKIHADVAKAFAQPELVARFVERGIELVASPSPEDFGQLIRSEVARLGKVAREAGIKAE